MKVYKLLLASASVLFSMNLYSQNIALSLEDLIPGGKTYSKYRAEMPRQLAWMGEELAYVKGDSILAVPLKDGGKAGLLLSVDKINSALSASGYPAVKSLARVRIAGDASGDVFIYSADNRVFLYNRAKNAIDGVYPYTEGTENLSFSKSCRYAAFTKENNLYISDSKAKETAITSDKDKGIVYGQAVHRNEFGINSGIFWSPAGNLLAFYRMDETMVTDYPLVDISKRIASLRDIKYPMAGMKSHHVTLGVYNPQTKNTVYLKTGLPKEKYLTNVAWSPDEKSIYIAEVNRGQDTCTMNRYNALTGVKEATLFVETHPKYVEPEKPVLFLKNNPSQFLWQSERDGYNHLYLYDVNGKMLKQLTSGKWDVTEVVGFDEKGENLVYISSEASPVEKHIYKVNLKTAKRTLLSKQAGVHRSLMSASGRNIADLYTSQHNAGQVDVTNVASGQTSVFYQAKDPYRNILMPEISIGSLKSSDSKVDLYYRMIKPLNFDAGKKYPVIVYVYGGPHSQLVDNSWMGQARGWDIYMAEKGYLVFTLDNRGTSGRGLDFENITHRRLGEVETDDQMAGVDYLRSLPYVDADRIGVHGWSFGGFMTLNLMLRHPETFKVGVAGGPVTDWKYYEIMYGERYMDSPQENPEGYARTSMVDRAGDLKGRLMLIHGDEDPTVVMQHSLQFINAAIKKGTHPDFFVYPGHGHNMTGHDRVHLHEHITRYFDDFLK